MPDNGGSDRSYTYNPDDLGYDPDDEAENNNENEDANSNSATGWVKGLNDLGLSLSYSPTLIAELADAGAIYESNGKLEWAEGWNLANYKTKLKGLDITAGSRYGW